MAPPKGGYAPNLNKFLDSLKSRPVHALVEDLIALLKRRQVRGSEDCAIATAHLLLQIVARDKWNDVNQLIERIQFVGQRLACARPSELSIVNIVRRVLGLIRDEAAEDRNEAESDTASDIRDALPSMANEAPAKVARPPVLNSLGPFAFARSQSVFNLLADPDVTPQNGTATPGSGSSTPLMLAQSTNVIALRSEVIDGIQEIIDEVKQVDEQVQAYVDVHIHPRDYILIHEPSRTVQKFLMRSKRKFTVFLVEEPSERTSDSDPYASFRKTLAATGSEVINVMNTGLAAYFSRVNKVILGARAITATGDVVVDAGAAAIARAARAQNRTVIVLGGVYKLSPDRQAQQHLSTDWAAPSKHVGFSEGQMVRPVVVDIKVAESELVPSRHINTYITNLGSHAQYQLDTLIADHYKEADIGFDFYEAIRK